MARPRWSLIWLVAGRMVLREGPPGRSVRRLGTLSVAAVVIGLLLLALGVQSLVIVATVAIASMLGLAALCLRVLSPAMAVSVVGIALSCASLMTALSVTDGFRVEITRAMARLNGHLLLTKYGLDFFEYDALAEQWLADPRVTAASPFAYSMVAVVRESPEGEAAEDEQGPSIVVGKGIDPVRAEHLDGIVDVMGRGDLSGLRPGGRKPPGLVLGRGLATRIGAQIGDRVRVVVPAELDGSGDALGREPRFATFELLDVLSTGTAEFDRNLALMHLTAGQSLFFREGRVTGIEFELTDPDLVDEVRADMEATLPQMYRITTWRETNASMLLGLEQIRIVVSLILGLMVIVASSSLIASLLLLVRRKQHDIAVMMAVGGDRGLMFWCFEAVGGLAGVSGAILGTMLGGLYCAVISGYHYDLGDTVYPVDHLPVTVSAFDVLGPAAVAIALASLASGPVAALAARVGLLGALRR
jgi:lipoprotein-releasing system permease protein